jgi:mannan endo-1,4-beta-mannosidase
MLRKLSVIIFFIIGAVCFAGCNGDDGAVPAPPGEEADAAAETPEPVPSPLDSSPATMSTEPFSVMFTAEDAILYGNVRVAAGGWLEGFEGRDDRCEFVVDIPADGFYDLNFISANIGGYKENFISVNGERLGVVAVPAEQDDFGDSVMERVFLYKGENVISYERYWGWVRLRSLHVTNSEPIDRAIFNVPATLVNPNASDRARRLMSYLADSYGNVILSGQYSDDGLLAGEAGIVFMETGKRPAVLGLDMMDLTPSRVARGTSYSPIRHILTAEEHGAIVTLCWHWNAPEKYITGTWYRAFYTEHTDIDLGKIMSGEDPEGFELLMSDIDVIAGHLKELADLDIPILWRPLHEAAGEWFWWGASGPEPYIELWKIMYEKLTFEHELNNLIWLWNGEAAGWYPGDDYVDMLGEDVYAGEHAYASQIQRFLHGVNYTSPPKIVSLSENGTLFDPDLAVRDGAMWSFFATWGVPFVRVNRGSLLYSENFTEREMLNKVYNHEIIITLDKLPCLKTYPIREN